MNDGFFLFTLVFIFGCKEERSNLVWSTRSSKKISHLCLQEGSNHMELSSFLFLVMAPTISRKHTALEYNERNFFWPCYSSIHRQKRVFYCTWLPSSGQVLQLFVQVPPNGPLNITCQKTRSPKKILTKYTKLVFTLFSARFQAFQLIPNVFIEDCHS